MDPIEKEVTLNSYVGRVPYQKALRGDLPVKISSIEGAGNREVYPSKERSWLPYFVKNATQLREGIHSRGVSRSSAGTPVNGRVAERSTVNGTPNKVALSSVHAPSFTPQSPAPAMEEDEEKPTKIKVNLPPVNTASSASPAVSDSSLHVHHPRPTKHINIADIDDSSARLKALLNPQTTTSPAHSHERTSSTALPETAIHAAPFQPSSFHPQNQPQQQQLPLPNAFGAPLPVFYPPFTGMPADYSTTQNPYAQPRFENNGMVYYFDPSYYYFQPTLGQNGTPVQSTSQSQSQQQPAAEQTDAQQSQQQMYFYQMGDMQRGQMGVYYPYQQGT